MPKTRTNRGATDAPQGDAGDAASDAATSAPYQPTCRHCHRRKPDRRGLCRGCYRQPFVRKLYGPINPLGNKVFTFDTDGKRPLAKRPTSAAPGSEAKIAIMAARVKARVAVFHPLDAGLATDELPLDVVQFSAGHDKRAEQVHYDPTPEWAMPKPRAKRKAAATA